MRLFVGRRIPRCLDELCFARTHRVLVGAADDFARRIAPMLAGSPPKGALAQG
jgi:hypothetical protein